MLRAASECCFTLQLSHLLTLEVSLWHALPSLFTVLIPCIRWSHWAATVTPESAHEGWGGQNREEVSPSSHQAYRRSPCSHRQLLHLRHGKGRRNTPIRLEDSSRTALPGSSPQSECIRYIYLPNQSLRKADKTRSKLCCPGLRNTTPWMS